MKWINIEKIEIKKIEDKARLICSITVDKMPFELLYEVDEAYSEAITDELSDGIIVTLLPYAIRGGYNIESNIPASSKLIYQLTKHVIPQICCVNDSAHNVTLKVEEKVVKYDPSGVATGISLGVDSFTTLKEYTEDSPGEDKRITHLTFFEVGAHHLGINGYSPEQEKCFLEQLDRVVSFCNKYNYNLIVVRSNLNEVLNKAFWNDPFDYTHTYRNVGTAMLLQRLIGTYYYSSAFNLDLFGLNIFDDPAYYEKFLLPLLSTDNISFYSSNCAMTRLEKTEYISSFSQSWDNLLVCYMGDRNCGCCVKCLRTMLQLDVLGKLELYRNSFDLEKYYRDRKRWLARIYAQKRYDPFMKETFIYAKDHAISIPMYSKI